MDFLNKYRAFKAGQLSQQEAEEFVAWMNSKEGEEKILRNIENDWNYQDAREATDETRLESILAQIKNETIVEKEQGSRNSFFSKLAAAVALLVVFAGLTYLVFPELQTLNQPQRIVKINPSGQKSTHFLPDGSKVYLNAESSISYVREFEGDKRIIDLRGEAYFEVTKNPEKPFVVKSNDLMTTALGTAFNVRAYANENKLSVALTEGKVRVTSTSIENEFFLNPGEQLQYYIDSKSSAKANFDTDEMVGWINGLIKFEDANFTEVRSRLERWFGVKIQNNKEPSTNWRYTGEFENQSLEMILEGMKLTKNFDYKMERKKVEIMFN